MLHRLIQFVMTQLMFAIEFIFVPRSFRSLDFLLDLHLDVARNVDVDERCVVEL